MNPCLRCGTFVPVEPVRGIPVCAECLDRDEPPDSMTAMVPPRAVIVRRLGILALFMAPGFVAGCWAGTFTPPSSTPWVLDVLFGGVFGALAGEILAMVAFRRILNAGLPIWKRHCQERVGLGHVPVESLRFAIYSPRRASLWDFRTAADPGVYFESPDGVVFFGVRGNRLAVEYARDATGAGPDHIDPIIFRGAARIDLRAGGACYLAVRESTSHRRNVALARAMIERVRGG